MSLTSSFTRPPKAFIDTTVLCGAIRKDGLNRKLLKLARSPQFYQPVLSRICLLEFMRNSSNGLGKGNKMVKYSEEEIMTFTFSFLAPIFDNYSELPVNSIVGRYSIETIIRENQPIGEVLTLLSGCSDEFAKQIAGNQEMSEPLHRFDQDDFHVWITAIQEKCDYIVTTNTRRFPSQIGNIQRIHPGDFYDFLISE
ncbi:PIN domain-containing protein [Oceanobacillus sp. AG]|uniref:PIN domain-containing protein n=1 Tax=Oceanobacillus sp. AG TaxID=2681969 RepID=UPI0012EB157B|nr:PIN domain-containing protein [Oceanobacillus sp. AG]